MDPAHLPSLNILPRHTQTSTSSTDLDSGWCPLAAYTHANDHPVEECIELDLPSSTSPGESATFTEALSPSLFRAQDSSPSSPRLSASLQKLSTSGETIHRLLSPQAGSKALPEPLLPSPRLRDPVGPLYILPSSAHQLENSPYNFRDASHACRSTEGSSNPIPPHFEACPVDPDPPRLRACGPRANLWPGAHSTSTLPIPTFPISPPGNHNHHISLQPEPRTPTCEPCFIPAITEAANVQVWQEVVGSRGMSGRYLSPLDDEYDGTSCPPVAVASRDMMLYSLHNGSSYTAPAPMPTVSHCLPSHPPALCGTHTNVTLPSSPASSPSRDAQVTAIPRTSDFWVNTPKRKAQAAEQACITVRLSATTDLEIYGRNESRDQPIILPKRAPHKARRKVSTAKTAYLLALEDGSSYHASDDEDDDDTYEELPSDRTTVRTKVGVKVNEKRKRKVDTPEREGGSRSVVAEAEKNGEATGWIAFNILTHNALTREIRNRSAILLFPERIFYIVHTGFFSEWINWNEAGTALNIFDEKCFAKEVQPYFLNTDAWDSCKRQLTSYNGRVKGFVRERYATSDGSFGHIITHPRLRLDDKDIWAKMAQVDDSMLGHTLLPISKKRVAACASSRGKVNSIDRR